MAFREGLYLLSVLACTFVNPAFLLINVGPPLRDPYSMWYILAPEMFVAQVRELTDPFLPIKLSTAAWILPLPIKLSADLSTATVLQALVSPGGLDIRGSQTYCMYGSLALNLFGWAALGAGLGEENGISCFNFM